MEGNYIPPMRRELSMSKFSLWLTYSTCRNAKRKPQQQKNQCVSTTQQNVAEETCLHKKGLCWEPLWTNLCKMWTDLFEQSYVYWAVHHLDSWIKIGQLDVTCFSLHKDTTPPQPNHTVTPTHIEPKQYNTWNKFTISRKLLKMDVLTFETCRAVNGEIIKQVTSSWSFFIQLFEQV
jgi:hypothetical protein